MMHGAVKQLREAIAANKTTVMIIMDPSPFIKDSISVSRYVLTDFLGMLFKKGYSTSVTYVDRRCIADVMKIEVLLL